MLTALANILSFALPSPLGPVLRATRPNPVAPNVPTQARVAAAQAVGSAVAGMRPTLALAGSEADYWSERAAGALVDLGDPTQPSVPAWGGYTGFGRPNLPPTSYTGPVRHAWKWGGSARSSAPTIVPGSLNPPGAATPTAREVQAAAQHHQPDLWGG